MFEKLIEQLRDLAGPVKTFDPSRFGDPIAMQTGWTPVRSGGANFRTHRLVEIDPNRIEFKASIGARLFYSVFAILGMISIVIFSFAKSSYGKFSFGFEMIMPILIGIAFVFAGVTLYYIGTTPIVFDKYKGCFWKGRKSPDEVSDKQEIKYFAHIGDIHALQLLSEYCSGSRGYYTSYELNLVLTNGSRINVVDHGNPAKLREDAQILSGFLGKPVWDAIG
jgi:hypothetical protein